jgi:voltage-dependent calcium channel
MRRDSRMGAPPQLAVPEIFVEPSEEAMEQAGGITPRDFTEAATSPLSPTRGASIDGAASTGGYDAKRASATHTPLGNRDSRDHSPIGSTFPSGRNSPHYMTNPSQLPGDPDVSSVSPAASASASPTRRGGGHLTPAHSRAGSSVSTMGMMDSLDNSAWGESLRRSFSTRQPQSRSHSRSQSQQQP